MRASPLTPEAMESLIGYLRNIDIFAIFTPEEMQRVITAFTLQAAEPGEAIVTQGGEADSFYLIFEGRLEVSRDDGKVAELGPGDFMGEIALLEEIPRTADVKAAGPAKVFSLTKADFQEFVGKNPNFEKRMREAADSRK